MAGMMRFMYFPFAADTGWKKLVLDHGYKPKMICLKPSLASRSSNSHIKIM